MTTAIERQKWSRWHDAIMRGCLRHNLKYLTSEIIEDGTRWHDLLLSLPAPHLLQSWNWGELKSRFGSRARRLSWRDTAGSTVAVGQLLTRASRLRGGLKVAHCPKGPVLGWGDDDLRSAVLAGLVDAAREDWALVLKIDPEVAYETGGGGGGAAQLWVAARANTRAIAEYITA